MGHATETEPPDQWWLVASECEASAAAADIVASLRGYGLAKLQALATKSSLVELWKSGQSPGIAEIQRKRYLECLVNEQTGLAEGVEGPATREGRGGPTTSYPNAPLNAWALGVHWLGGDRDESLPRLAGASWRWRKSGLSTSGILDRYGDPGYYYPGCIMPPRWTYVAHYVLLASV